MFFKYIVLGATWNREILGVPGDRTAAKYCFHDWNKLITCCVAFSVRVKQTS